VVGSVLPPADVTDEEGDKHRRVLGGLMRKHPWRATAVASLLVAAPLAVLATSTGAATAATAVPGAAPLVVSGAFDTGALAATPMHVTIALDLRDKSGLDALIAQHRTVAPDAFLSSYAPAQATVDAVRSWAGAQGLRVDSVSANRTLVRVSGSSTDVGSALGVAFHTFRTPDGSRYWASVGTASLPASFSDQVSGLLGLSSIERLDAPKPAAVGSLDFPRSYGPKDLWQLYNAPSSATGAGQSVAVIAEGDLTIPRQDLRTFEATYGLPQVPWTTVQVGPASTDTAGNDEWDLDTQYSTGMAPDVSALYVYDGFSLANDDILATINRWVTDDITRQASFSAGECELLAFASGFTGPLDNALAQANAQGQSLFVSSGDTGSFCPVLVGVNGVPAGIPGVNYPASSPGAIGVGGTTVLGPGPNEVAWYAGGGGTSYVEPVPAFQASAGGSFLGVARGVPDVALDADPNSGYEVVVAGQKEIIGGTSASAPAWQGIWARAQSAHGGSLGTAGPVVYGVPASVYNDITIGAIGHFVATPGWDYTTGRGTPNITAFVNAA
jgi:pseudomonalisin